MTEPLGETPKAFYEPGTEVKGTKFWNAKKGKGVVLERLDATKVVVKWEHGEAEVEWDLDLELPEEND